MSADVFAGPGGLIGAILSAHPSAPRAGGLRDYMIERHGDRVGYVLEEFTAANHSEGDELLDAVVGKLPSITAFL